MAEAPKDISDLQPIRENGCITGEGRGTRVGRASLHPAYFAATVVTCHPIEHVKEAWLVLIEARFEVGSARPWEILGAPLDVEGAIGRSTSHRGEDPKTTV